MHSLPWRLQKMSSRNGRSKRRGKSGNQTSGIASMGERPSRLVHRQRTDRPSIPGARSSTRRGCFRDIRARRTDSMAYTSARPNTDSGGGPRLGAARGWTRQRDSPWRCGLVPARRKALARSHIDDGHDTHSHPGEPGRKGGRLDGTSHRRTVPEGIVQAKELATLEGAMPKRLYAHTPVRELSARVTYSPNNTRPMAGARPIHRARELHDPYERTKSPWPPLIEVATG